jgi:hypothetical protein
MFLSLFNEVYKHRALGRRCCRLLSMPSGSHRQSDGPHWAVRLCRQVPQEPDCPTEGRITLSRPRGSTPIVCSSRSSRRGRAFKIDVSATHPRLDQHLPPGPSHSFRLCSRGTNRMRRKFHASMRCNLVNAAAQYFRSDFRSRARRQSAGRTIAILRGLCGPRRGVRG